MAQTTYATLFVRAVLVFLSILLKEHLAPLDLSATPQVNTLIMMLTFQKAEPRLYLRVVGILRISKKQRLNLTTDLRCLPTLPETNIDAFEISEISAR